MANPKSRSALCNFLMVGLSLTPLLISKEKFCEKIRNKRFCEKYEIFCQLLVDLVVSGNSSIKFFYKQINL